MNITELPNFDEATEKLAPEEYLRFLQGVSLDGVVLDTLETTVNREAAAKAREFNLKVDFKCRLAEIDASTPDLLLDYTIRGLSGGKPALRIKATYRLRLSAEDELPREFFSIYGKGSGDNQTWPYLRELAHSLTLRMGMPALVLPLRIHGAGRAPVERKT